MVTKPNLKATMPVDDIDAGFTATNDLFGLKVLGQGMTNIVSTISEPLVIALTGTWGSGKTVFLRQWEAELKKGKYPVIYFDAFENDFVGDAFSVIAREILQLRDNTKSEPQLAIEKVRSKAIKVGSMILSVGSKLAVKAAVRAATVGTVSSGDVAETFKDIADEAGDFSEALVTEFIDGSAKQKEIVQKFKEALSQLPEAISPAAPDEKQKPLIFIIDELDRCKPSFALELLERIKHFLSVRNVHFVLGLNMNQLQASVRAAYGQDIDAIHYLQKFISLEIAIQQPDLDPSRSRNQKFISHLASKVEIPKEHAESFGEAVNSLVKYAIVLKMNLRTIEKIFFLLQLSFIFTPATMFRMPHLVTGLCVLKILYLGLFEKTLNGKLTYAEVENALLLNEQPRDQNRAPFEWERKWWQYFLLPTLPEEFSDFANSLRRFNLGNRLEVIPWLAVNVVGKLVPNS